jgi:hypothetical protein
MYDFISPPFGRLAALEKLFERLGYERSGPTFHTRGRRAVILGNVLPEGASEADWVRTYNLLGPMTENGSAILLLGPVEFQLLASTPSSTVSLSELNQWRFTFPLWMEGNGFRAVYGAWLDSEIRVLNSTLAGRRIQPDRITVLTRDGQRTSEALHRILTYSGPRSASTEAPEHFADSNPHDFSYSKEAPPLFLGRSYPGVTSIIVENRCYLDTSSDARIPLRAYRWNSDGLLSPSNLVEVR